MFTKEKIAHALGYKISKFTVPCCDNGDNGTWKLCVDPLWINSNQYKIDDENYTSETDESINQLINTTNK